MASLDQTSASYFLKTLYPREAIENMVYKTHPLLSMLKKNTGFKGENMKIPVSIADIGGVSSTFSTALANKSAGKGAAFFITRAKAFALASIDYETLKSTEGDSAAFTTAIKIEMDRAYNALSRSLAISMFGTGSGSLGQVDASTTLTGAILILKNINDVVKFEVGQVIVASTTDGGGSVKTARTITNIDRSAGTVTFNSNLNTGTAWASQDYLFVEGNYDLQIKGLRAWIPDSAPTSTPFFLVDRSVDTDRLGGLRFNGSAMPIEEALINAASLAARAGATPDVIVMNFNKYRELEISLGSKVQYVDIKTETKAQMGFRGMLIMSPTGPMKIVADRDCPSDRAFMLQLDTWTLHSLGEAPVLQDADGNKMLREANANSLEFRLWYSAQLACTAPGYNVNIYLG